MRPLKLKLTAFGPYKHTETIDFADLKGNQLFVISGSTGSGKTTIFDGICFALYGAASGSDRAETRNLRSDFAEDGTHTCVEMEFEIHRKVYRILRQMGHVKKGNKSATGEKYEFFEVTDKGEVPCVERQMVSEINRRVEEIIGLSQNQFSQIVMLPQGEFRKLLTSETDNKEEILRKIFKTEPYKMISERLKQRKDAAAKAYQYEEHTLASLINGIASVLPQRDSELFELLEREHFNVNQVLHALEHEAVYYNEKAVNDEQAYLAAYELHNGKLEGFHEAKKWNDRLQELEEKNKRLEVMKERLPQITDQEMRLQKAERAGLIEGTEILFKELQANEITKEQSLEKAIDDEFRTSEQLKNAEHAFSIEQGKEKEREDISQRLIQLENILPSVREIDGKKQELKAMEAAAAAAQKNLSEAAAKFQLEKEAHQQLGETISALEQKLEPFDSKNTELNSLKERSRILQELLAAETDWQTQQRIQLLKEQRFKELDGSYQALENSWLANQAQILAASLHDGEACPVCGSTEHPQKFSALHHTAVTKEELDAAKAEFSQADGEYRNAAAKLNALEEQLSLKKERAAQFGGVLEDASTAYEETEEKRKALELEVAALSADKKQLRSLKEQLNLHMEKLEALEAGKTAAAEKAQHLAASCQTAIAVFEQSLLAIPEELRNLSVLEKKIQNEKSLKTQLAEAWEKAQQQLQEAKERQATAVITVKHTKEAAEEIKLKKEKAEQQFKEALQKSDFDTEEAYEQAKLSEQQQAALKDKIQEFKQTHYTLLEQVKELEDALAGKTRADLPGMEAELVRLKQAYEDSLATWNRAKESRLQISQLSANISKAYGQAAEMEKQMNRVADLYDMVRGQNQLKISFERYLQIEYLEQIIHSANERLKNLSNGQFYLIRSDRQEARGKQSGLGLDVYDAYTGQTRDVKTLSGGEKFNASLCLALGMADVIQSFQGNVAIDTMFIDEGFGSLDDESLNKSIDTLIDLQKSGRMIGVISHVQELKAAIPAILEVKKSKEGFSQTKFVLK